jgi:hypothetical protein
VAANGWRGISAHCGFHCSNLFTIMPALVVDGEASMDRVNCPVISIVTEGNRFGAAHGVEVHGIVALPSLTLDL